MKVKELMTRDVKSCSMIDRVDHAARLMWEGDLGALPVIDPEGLVEGVITDRDICMAALTKGRPLAALTVRDAMAKRPSTCTTDATLESAMAVMSQARVRRLPVVDESGRLTGLLSMNDLAREACRQRKGQAHDGISTTVVETLGSICEPRRKPAAEPAKAGSRAKAEPARSSR